MLFKAFGSIKARQLGLIATNATLVCGLAGVGVAVYNAQTWNPAVDPTPPPLLVRVMEALGAGLALYRGIGSAVLSDLEDATPQDEEALLFKGVVAGALADMARQPKRARALAAAAEGGVVEWLLGCLRRGGSAEQREGERALAAIIGNGQVAGLVWSRSPSSLVRMLDFVAQVSDTGPLSDAILAATAGGAATRLSGGAVPLQADVSYMASLAAGRHGPRVRQAATWALAEWSSMSQARPLVAAAGSVPALLQAACDARGREEERTVHMSLARAVASLAPLCPPHQLAACVPVLTSVLEAAVAGRDAVLAARALDALAAVLDGSDSGVRGDLASRVLTGRPSGRGSEDGPQDTSSSGRVMQSQAAAGTGLMARALDRFAAIGGLPMSDEAAPHMLMDMWPLARAEASSFPAEPAPALLSLLHRAVAMAAPPPGPEAPPDATTRDLQGSIAAFVRAVRAADPEAPRLLDGPALILPMVRWLTAQAEESQAPGGAAPPAAQDRAMRSLVACLSDLASVRGAFGEAVSLLWAAQLLREAALSRTEHPEEAGDGYLGTSFLRYLWGGTQQEAAPSAAAGPASASVPKSRRPASATPRGEGEASVSGRAVGTTSPAAVPKANPMVLARSLAAEAQATAVGFLRTASQFGAWEDPPPDPVQLSTWKCLELLGDLSLDHEGVLKSLASLGLLSLLHAVGPGNAGRAAAPPGGDRAQAPKAPTGHDFPHLLRRTCLRYLAALAAHKPFVAPLRADLGWMRFLRSSVQSPDLRYASNARRALLHLEQPSPGAGPRYLDGVHLMDPMSPTLAAAASDDQRRWVFDIIMIHGLRGGAYVTWRKGYDAASSAAAKAAAEARAVAAASRAVAAEVSRKDGPSTAGSLSERQRDLSVLGMLAEEAVEEEVPPHTPLPDGLPHNEAGGPGTYMQVGQSWPTTWLGPEWPTARVLTVEYAAPASDADGHVLPFDEMGSRMLDKLAAAWVGKRPVVFVTHSLGGLLTKEMLLQSSHEPRGTDRARLSTSVAGIAFYSCPHFGSWLADIGWRLKHVGGSPSLHVATLRTGPHLEDLNGHLRALYKSGKVKVLSFLESGKTPLVTGPRGYGINVEIVPYESAYPGFGDLEAVPLDHIQICKPRSREDKTYVKLVEFIRALDIPGAAKPAQQAQQAVGRGPPPAAPPTTGPAAQDKVGELAAAS